MDIYIKNVCNEPEVKKSKLCHDTKMLGSNESEKDVKCENLRMKEDTEKSNIQKLEDKAISPTDQNNDLNLFPFPQFEDVSDIMNDIDFEGPFPSVTDRYFTPYYKMDVQRPGDDICILIHSNRICMITLAQSHNVFREGISITQLSFKVSSKLDRASNKVSGKGKHGAQPLQENANICSITCSDNQVHMIKCCMVGKLVEVNESLIENPNLLREPPHRGGYLAIVLLNIKLLDKMKHSLLTKDLYESALAKRCTQSNDSINNDLKK